MYRLILLALYFVVVSAVAACSQDSALDNSQAKITPNVTPLVTLSPTPELTYPRYGHARDFSWVAGVLQRQPLEGGCWILVFSEKPENADAYLGRLALKVPAQLNTELRDGRFVVVSGKVIGDKFGMACPPTIYEATTIRSN